MGNCLCLEEKEKKQDLKRDAKEDFKEDFKEDAKEDKKNETQHKEKKELSENSSTDLEKTDLQTYHLKNCTLNNTKNFSLCDREIYAKVLEVYDGDTITIAFYFSGDFYKKRCRIYGVDCPEIKTKNLQEKKAGYEAKKFVENLILEKIVKVVFTKKEDKYGRLLGIVYLDMAERLDLHIIKNGHGVPYFGGKKSVFK